ncbi:transcriptional regulatory protein rxt3, partial [Irineochytrium annulatum]
MEVKAENVMAGVKRSSDDAVAAAEAMSVDEVDVEGLKKARKGYAGTVTVINHESLKIPPGKDKSLGYVIYDGAHMADRKSDKAADMKLFLLPAFNTSHLYATIEIRIPAEFLTFNENIAVKHQALWGTEIYTDDSDIVAVIIHAGFYRPVDAPPSRSPPPPETKVLKALPNGSVAGSDPVKVNGNSAIAPPPVTVTEPPATAEQPHAIKADVVVPVEATKTESVGQPFAEEPVKATADPPKGDESVAPSSTDVMNVEEAHKPGEGSKSGEILISDQPSNPEEPSKPGEASKPDEAKPDEASKPAAETKPKKSKKSTLSDSTKPRPRGKKQPAGRPLPPQPSAPLTATPSPHSRRPLPDHDLSVTVRVLPRLTRYAASTRHGIASRGWGGAHAGESIR